MVVFFLVSLLMLITGGQFEGPGYGSAAHLLPTRLI